MLCNGSYFIKPTSAFDQTQNMFGVKARQAFSQLIQMIRVNLPVIKISIVRVKFLNGCL
jgi:hypothetical protein